MKLTVKEGSKNYACSVVIAQYAKFKQVKKDYESKNPNNFS